MKQTIQNALSPVISDNQISPLPLSNEDRGELKNRLDTLGRNCQHSNPLLIKPGVYEPTHGSTKEDEPIRKPTLPITNTWESGNQYPEDSFYDTTIDLSNHYLVGFSHEEDAESPALYWIEINNKHPPQRDNRDFSITLHGQNNHLDFPLTTFIKGVHHGFIYPLLYLDEFVLYHSPSKLGDHISEIFYKSPAVFSGKTDYIKDAQEKYREKYDHAQSANNISTKTQNDRHQLNELHVNTKLGPIDLTNYTGIRTHTFGENILRTYKPLITSSGHPIIKTKRTTKPHYTQVYSLKSFIAHLESMQFSLCTFDVDAPLGSVTEFDLAQATSSYQIDSA